ncbi:hypothetical protein AESSP_02199 [Aestuariimicrobium sp. T2.26MG-19.2B]|nr:hypothetical protein AESSP_02199 [Aestuariimicrobium sp. T2.26MG-19.2B]
MHISRRRATIVNKILIAAFIIAVMIISLQFRHYWAGRIVTAIGIGAVLGYVWRGIVERNQDTPSPTRQNDSK